jgi:hypothetical protein
MIDLQISLTYIAGNIVCHLGLNLQCFRKKTESLRLNLLRVNSEFFSSKGTSIMLTSDLEQHIKSIETAFAYPDRRETALLLARGRRERSRAFYAALRSIGRSLRWAAHAVFGAVRNRSRPATNVHCVRPV